MRIARALLITALPLLALPLHGATKFVIPEGTGDGSSWAQASSLSNALATANNGDDIWIAAGTYSNNGTFAVATPALTLYGGLTNGMATLAGRDITAYPTLLDGQATRRVIEIAATNVALDGLVITNGRHNADGCGLYAGAGADALSLVNCTITHNESSVSHIDGGGAAFVNCSVFISNSLFRGNMAAVPASIWYEGGGGFQASGADITIVDSVFTNNGNNDIQSRDGNRGGAFLMYGGSLAVSGTTFVDNGFYGRSGDYNGGGAGRLVSVNPAHFSDCLFASNYVWSTTDRNTSGGGLIVEGSGSQVLIEHCIFDGNYCVQNDAQGAALCVVAGVVAVSNCTFVNNRTDDQGGAIHVYGGTLTVENSIFWTNTAAIRGQDISLFPGGSATLSHCRIGGDEETDAVFDGGAGIFIDNLTTVDPRFAGDGDYHLRSKGGRWDPALNGGAGGFTNDAVNSLCIDAGDPASAFSGELAPNGGRVNLGRFGNTVEASRTLDTAPVVTNIGFSVTNTLMSMSGQLVINNSEAAVGFYYGLTDGVENFASWDDFLALPGRYETGAAFSNSVGNLLPNTTYFFRCFATNSAGQDFADNVMTFTTGDLPPGGPPGILHVKPDAPGTQDGSTWFDAYHSLVDAMTAVTADTNEIWAASGVVQNAGTLTIATNVNIYGGFTGTTETNRSERDVSANVTVLDGEGVRRVVNISDGTVLLDGLTVTNGHATTGAGIYASGHDTVTLANCQVIDNHHGNNGCNGAGAYFNGGSVLIANTTFADNSASYGGGSIGYAAGISAHSVNMIIVDSLFRSNSLENIVVRDGEGGGAIWANHGTLAVTNTTFVGNRGNQASVNTRGGGACFLKGTLTATFKNCAFVGNVCAAPTYPTRIPSGGALQVAVSSGYTVTLENCSIGHGSAHGDGGAIIARSGELIIKNSILWTNEITGSGSGKEIYVTGASTTVSNQYSIYTGTNSTYVTINSGTVNWGPGNNTSNPLFASSSDLHLQSTAGRYDPATQTFVTSDVLTSPALDTGDPGSPFAREPAPNGSRINMGAFGNTAQASKTPGASFGFAITNGMVSGADHVLEITASDDKTYRLYAGDGDGSATRVWRDTTVNPAGGFYTFTDTGVITDPTVTSRYYHIVEQDGSTYSTNPVVWAMQKQRRSSNAWHMVSAPVHYGSSAQNSMAGTLGQQLGDGLIARHNQILAPELYAWDDGISDWTNFWYFTNGNWYAGPSTPATYTIDPGRGVWVKTKPTDPGTSNTIFSGQTHTNAGPIAMTSNTWILFSWPFASHQFESEGTSGNKGWQFDAQGGTGGADWNSGDRMFMQWNAIWYNLYMGTNGRWYNQNSIEITPVALEHGRAYYYYSQGPTFNWTPTPAN